MQQVDNLAELGSLTEVGLVCPKIFYQFSLLSAMQFLSCELGELAIGSTDNPLVDILFILITCLLDTVIVL